mmetsp:Transcript_3052/g.7664  ORF Transcript_3052/g.7664 Transcript_3052/m.7664 type:complete len:309 (+) Transcript_3052:105-1031(+)
MAVAVKVQSCPTCSFKPKVDKFTEMAKELFGDKVEFTSEDGEKGMCVISIGEEVVYEKKGKGKGKGKDKDKDKDKDKGKDKDKKGKDKDKDKKGKGKDDGKGEDEWPRPPNSVFKTHVQAGECLWTGGVERIGKKKAKVVIVCRNPKDALLSMWKQEKVNCEYEGEFSEWFDMFLQDFPDRHGPGPKCFWTWYADWWKVKESNDGVCWVVFEDLKRDLKGQVRKVAEFLAECGVEITEELIDKVTFETSFEQMKSKEGSQLQSLLTKGKAGGWRNEITGDLLEKFDKVHEQKMKELDIPFSFDFGDAQ